jgi:NhaP-type Na+/H+ or K+/H+ antiporter
MVIYLYELLFIALFTMIGYNYPPFRGTTRAMGAIFGAAFALALSLLVFKIKKTELKYLWSSLLGLLGGVVVGWLTFQMFTLIAMSFSAYVFFKALFLFGIPLTGLFIGASKPNIFS